MAASDGYLFRAGGFGAAGDGLQQESTNTSLRPEIFAAVDGDARDDDDASLSLLTVPAETRLRIYTALFRGMILSPAWRDLGPGASRILAEPLTDLSETITRLWGLRPVMDRGLQAGRYPDETSEWDDPGAVEKRPPQPRYPVRLDLLRVCRKVYGEAMPVLLSCATFKVASVEDHLRLTQPVMLPRLSRLRRLSLAAAVLKEWSATLVRLVLPSLSHLEIRDLDCPLSHYEMTCLEDLLPNGDALLASEHTMAVEEILVFMRQLIFNLDDANLSPAIVSQFTAAPDLYESLVLHFRIDCKDEDMRPHTHKAEQLVLAFGNIHSRKWDLGVTTVPEEKWKETIFLSRPGFCMAKKS